MDKPKSVDSGHMGEKHGEKQINLNPIISVGEGQVEADVEKYGTLHRTLTPRMIHVRLECSMQYILNANA